jgi:neutral trehalase
VIRDKLIEGMEAVLWNEEDGIWYDYDMESNNQRRVYYASNLGNKKLLVRKST